MSATYNDIVQLVLQFAREYYENGAQFRVYDLIEPPLSEVSEGEIAAFAHALMAFFAARRLNVVFDDDDALRRYKTWDDVVRDIFNKQRTPGGNRGGGDADSRRDGDNPTTVAETPDHRDH